MGLDNQVLAGSVCVAVICLTFAVTAKRDEGVVEGDIPPDAPGRAPGLSRSSPKPHDVEAVEAVIGTILRARDYWTENEMLMTIAEREAYLRGLRTKEWTFANRTFREMDANYIEGIFSTQEEQFQKLYSELETEVERSIEEMTELVQGDIEEIAVNLGETKTTSIPKPVNVTFDQSSINEPPREEIQVFRQHHRI